MKKLMIISVLMIMVFSITFVWLNNKKIPFYNIVLKSDIINMLGWKMTQYNKHKCEKYYSFEKNKADTTFFFGFHYYKKDKLCGFKKGLGLYTFTKDFPLEKTIYCRISLNLEGDTLYAFKRDRAKDYDSDKRTIFIKGKYYYKYRWNKNKLDSCQINYFEENKDSLIKAGANTIPEFDENCEMIKEK